MERSGINKEFEESLINNKEQLSYMNNLLFKYEFSEDFLIKTRIYYDSWKCLRSQSKLSPYFCFYYLYDRQDYDSADNWTDYNDIYRYLRSYGVCDEEINKAFTDATNDRNKYSSDSSDNDDK